MNMDERKKSWELAAEKGKKVTTKPDEGQGYNSIFKELHGPVSTVANIIKKFKVHETIDNVEISHKRKTNPTLDRRVQMVEKEPRKTSQIRPVWLPTLKYNNL